MLFRAELILGPAGMAAPARADEHQVCTSVTLIVSELRSGWQ